MNALPYDAIGSKPEPISHTTDNGQLTSRIMAGHYPYIGATDAGIVKGEIYLVAVYSDGSYQKTEAILVLDSKK